MAGRTYQNAPESVLQLVERTAKVYHGGLHDAGVTYDVLWAFPPTDKNGDPTGSAIQHAGYECAAGVKLMSLKERTKGSGDIEITIDKQNWDLLDEEERIAMLDHELCHCVLRTDPAGGVKRDDLDRPLIRMEKHDHHFGWFDACVRRHGKASAELQQFRFFEAGAYSQLWLPFAEQPESKAG